FFFSAPSTTEIYTLSLHDALPILIDVYGVAIDVHRVPAREDNVVYVAVTLVFGLRTKDPRIASQQALFRILKLEQCEAQPEKCRSEEHTSELQSRGHLVCRLLLEK